jgi:tetratricopeptide (TPR) repeat protein
MNRSALAIILAGFLGLAGCSREAAEARYLAKGRVFFQKRDYARALLEFKNATQQIPLDAEPYYQIGLTYVRLKNPALAAAAFNRATELNPKHVGAQLKLAEILVASSDEKLLRDAETRVKDVLKSARDNVEALNILALLEWNLGEKDKAQERLYEAFQKSSKPDSITQLARMKLYDRDLKGAEELLTNAVRQQPQSVDLELLLGEFYAATGNKSEAEIRFRHILTVQPRNEKVLEELGALYVANGQLDLADTVYRQLAELPKDRLRTAHAQFLLQTGRADAGIQELEALFRKEPRERSRRTLLVGAYLQAGRLTDAQRILDRALKENKEDSEALFQKGVMDLSHGDLDRAIGRLDAVLALNPDSAETHYFVGKVHQLRGATASYKRELNRAVELKPDLLPARVDLAKELLSNNAATSALQLMNNTPSWQRGALPAIIQRNWALLANDQRAELRAEIDRGLKLARAPELLVQDAMLRMQEGNYGAAMRAAEEALQQDKDNLAGLTILVAVYRAQRQNEKALLRVQKCAADNPGSASAQYLLGELLMETGRTDEARTAFAAARNANPDLLTAGLALATLDLARGRLEEARSTLSDLLARQPSNGDGQLMMANIAERSGKYEEAVQRYQAVLEWDPTNVRALNNLAYVLADRMNRADEALQYAEKAKQMAPNDAIVDDTLGWVLYRKGLYPMAVAKLRNSVARDPSPKRQLHLAMAYFKAGDAQQARELLQMALPRASGLPEAKEAVEVVRP